MILLFYFSLFYHENVDNRKFTAAAATAAAVQLNQCDTTQRG
jgi:hypothetical protein